MTWAEFHESSAALAESARDLARRGEPETARHHFAQAAEAEEQALACVNPETEPRTFGATAVSATALWYKAGEFENARRVAHQALQAPTLAPFAQDQIRELLDTMSPQAARASRTWRWALPAGIAAAVVLAAIGWRLFSAQTDDYVTRTGETRQVTLEAGSVAYLNTRTDLRRVDSSDARRVELVAGEVLFDVRHDAARPFIVKLDDSEIRVIGTRFNVYRRPQGQIAVTVIEGVVEIRGHASDGTGSWVRRVSAGQQIEYRPTGLISEPHAADAESAESWRSRKLKLPAEGMPLEKILDELTRYTDQRILIRDPRVAQQRIGGIGVVLPTNDVRGALDQLKSVAPIEWTESDGTFVIEATPVSKN